jgi:hypothetical protein
VQRLCMFSKLPFVRLYAKQYQGLTVSDDTSERMTSSSITYSLFRFESE